MLHESNRIEFKSVLNDKMEKEVVDLDSTQLKIADRIKNNILPATLGLFDIVTEVVENIPVIKVLISSGLEKPYYIKSQGMSPTGCYTRIGTSSQPMTTAMIDDLYARHIHTTLRNILSPRQDLKFAQLKIYYQERGLELNEQFASSLELLTPDGKYNYIGYLLADENGVSVKVAKYAGTDKVDLIENEEYGYCSLIKATYRVLDKMKIENVTHAKVTSSKRIEKNLVAPVAMREAIINCIVHNDFTREIPPVFEIFSDRIVMTSYGGLIPGQSEADFFSCSSMPRNRELMRVFRDTGLVEQLGSGMSRILRAYDKSVFQISDHFIKVVFPLAEAVSEENVDNGTATGTATGTANSKIGTANDIENKYDNLLNRFSKSKKKKVIQLIKELDQNGGASQDELAVKIAVGKRTVARYLAELGDMGIVEYLGATKNGTYILK